MKLLPLLLMVSVVANASLLVVHLRTDGAGGAAGGAGAANGSSAGGTRGFSSGGSASGARPAATGESGAIARALQSGDAESLRDELRAAGVDEDIVRSIVGMRLWKRHEARMRALQAGPGAKLEWWKNDNDMWGGRTKEQRAELKALQAEIKAESERLLGKDPNAPANPWLERQYGFLPAEKRDALQQLEQDYNELSSELRQETQGFTLPSDREKTKFLMAEKRADLEALLTPEELQDYDLRQSRTAQNLRWQMTQMDASEAEYRAIFEVRKEFDDVYNDHDQFGNRTRTMTPEDWKARGEAEKAMKAEIKQALGAERYAEYLRSQDNDYQQLRKATERFELPADTPGKVYALRDEVPAAALRIADDTSLTPEQKKAEVAKLAADARDRVKGMLGAEVAQAYFEQNGMQWLQQLEKGTIITFDEEGGQQHRRLDQAPKKSATK